MNEVMIDFETLGVAPGCVVHEFGAVRFDSKTRRIGDSLHLVVSIDDSIAHGLTVEKNTLDWWNNRGGPNQQNARTLHNAAKILADFLSGAQIETLWSWGTCFDLPIIRACFRAASVDWPVPYYAARDARTVWDLAFRGVIHERRGNHDALADCRCQIRQLFQAFDALAGQCAVTSDLLTP